jgi:type II restriction enzyme
VDLFLVDAQGCEYYIDIKTAKPNINEFRGFKRSLLEWVGIRKSLGKDVAVKTLLAIPYNPYAPQPYDRWTGRGLFDYGKELLVGDQFWDFLGGGGTYQELLQVFEEVGQNVQSELRQLFDALK